ncbi:YitT family protein [Ligilactobacillus faecis]|uniref:YitT family protein n=1 Tax=Ligilactobacillus faecis TaxID=762833 RepID=A0ABV4DNH4_9LACO|nr:YitT family protein [Ligilactobacillus faecis]WGN90108.1 YitT family protein [Ligilactobacillus faecis]
MLKALVMFTKQKHVKNCFLAVTYGLLSAIAVNLFLNNAQSYSIGVTGIAQLLQAILAATGIHLTLSLLMFLLNIPLFIFAWHAFGLRYITYSLLAVISSISFIQLIPEAVIVKDPLTNTLIGAALVGIGVGFCFNNGFSTGGTDIIVNFIQLRYHKKVGFVNNLINSLILIITALFFDLGRTVYSLIGMLVTSYLMDHFFILQKDVNILIFTKKSAQITDSLKKFVHGATLVQGTGVYTGEPTDVIIIVAQKSQLNYLKHLIQAVDPDAFISTQSANAELGNYQRVFDA